MKEAKKEKVGIILATVMMITVVGLVVGEFLGLGSIRPAHVNAILAASCGLLLGRYVKNLQGSK